MKRLAICTAQQRVVRLLLVSLGNLRKRLYTKLFGSKSSGKLGEEYGIGVELLERN